MSGGCHQFLGSPWLVVTGLQSCPCCHMVFPLVSASRVSSSYGDTGHIDLRAHLTAVWSCLNKLYLQGSYFLIRSHWDALKIRTSAYLLGGYNSTHYRVLLAVSASPLSLLLMPCTILRNIGQVFLEYLSNGIFLVCFSWLDRGYEIWGGRRKHKGAVPLSPQPIKATYYQQDSSLLVLTVVTWLT